MNNAVETIIGTIKATIAVINSVTGDPSFSKWRKDRLRVLEGMMICLTALTREERFYVIQYTDEGYVELGYFDDSVFRKIA